MNLSILQSPFPRIKHVRQQFKVVALIGVMAGAFILLFEPFGIANDSQRSYVNFIILGFGLVFILSVAFMEWLVPLLTPSFFKKWNLGKAFIWYSLITVFIAFNNFLYKSYWEGFEDFGWNGFALVLERTLGIGIIVILTSLSLIHYMSRKRLKSLTDKETCEIIGENGEKIQCTFDQILFITSDNNYVDIHLLVNNTRTKHMLRSSLKNIEQQLISPLSPIRKCHRRYLINQSHFEIIAENSRAITLGLKDGMDQIQVSKSYVNKIRAVIPIRTKDLSILTKASVNS